MTNEEYKEFLIDSILGMQKKAVFTLEQLQEKTTRALEVIFDNL